MPNQHPLTEKICLDISKANHHPWDQFELMRAAADWQLEQVMSWGYKYLYPDQVNALREAMRPQQKEHDAAPWLEITYDAFKLTSDPE
jgi:hypothetical protein